MSSSLRPPGRSTFRPSDQQSCTSRINGAANAVPSRESGAARGLERGGMTRRMRTHVELKDYWTAIRHAGGSCSLRLVAALAAAPHLAGDPPVRLLRPALRVDEPVRHLRRLPGRACSRPSGWRRTPTSSTAGQLAERVSDDLGGDVDPDDLTDAGHGQGRPGDGHPRDHAPPIPTRSWPATSPRPTPRALSDLVADLETPTGRPTPLIKASIVDNAQVSTRPVSPQPLRNLGLAAVLGLLLGVGLAVARELLDTSVSSADDVADVTDDPDPGPHQQRRGRPSGPPTRSLARPRPGPRRSGCCAPTCSTSRSTTTRRSSW